MRSELLMPLLVTAIGVIALLANTGVLSAAALSRLAELWPVALIVAGLLVIISRTWDRGIAAALSVAVTIAALGGSIGYAVAGATPAERISDLSRPLGTLTAAHLLLNHGGGQITINGSTNLGRQLFRAHIVNPSGGDAPTVTLQDGELTVEIPSGGSNPFASSTSETDITLSSAVSWSIDLHGGATHGTLDLAVLRVSDLSVEGGATDITTTLPVPGRDVAVTFAGGSSHLVIHAPSGVAVKISINGGASSLHADGQEYGSVHGMTTYATPLFNSTTNRYTITVNGGANDVTLDRSS